MENLKKLRTPLRTSFTKAVKTFEELLKDDTETLIKEDLQASLDSIERRAEQIADLDKGILESMMKDEKTTEEQFATEYEGITSYEDKLFQCRRKSEKVLGNLADKAASEYGTGISAAYTKKDKKYKLPKIEFTKFGGEIKEWLAFWAQFQKIHKDQDMPNEDKFHYLRQSTLENSKAREVVDSFPMTAENYEKVIVHLTDRFGNKDTLVEVYVRELLKIVLANAMNSTKKMIISTLYDKLETQLRALESLEVTRDKFVAILYPLVESCLPEELLRAWERYRIMPTNGQHTDSLSQLMVFLKGEVESEERISLARSGFGDHLKKNQRKEEKLNDVPTAAGLFVGSSNSKGKISCIFCCKSHYSDQCMDAKKMTLTERQKKVEEQRACFACLRKGHISRECVCKAKLKCRNCNGQHCQIMCTKNSREMKEKPAERKEKINEIEITAQTKNLLVKERCKEETVLSTMLIRIRNGKKVKIIRAAIDSGSHKTYMLKSLIEELGYTKNGQERLFHELFGGHRTKETVHGRYTICAENLEGDFTYSFDVLEQEQICYDVPKMQKGAWLEELRQKNIILSDVGVGSSEIQLLIGGNIAGRLLVEIHKLGKDNDFVAMNYRLGWTIMGQIPTYVINNDTTLLVHTLMVRDAQICDLWRLDLIGIEDAAETRKKEKSLEAVNEHFKKTLKLNKEGRYEIALPFINGCPALKDNKILAERRLLSMTRKLNPELRNDYQKIFESWEEDGIIEKVPTAELDNYGHYLPHKAVLKPNSLTTPVRPVFDASAKEKMSISLNDCLEKGPNLLEVITSVLNRFRMKRHGTIADIKKAFLQISIRSEDRDYLRFLWRDKNSDSKIQVYRHKRVVFGLTCSSFLLAATINHILDQAPSEYKDTARQLKNANYVDNCITSFDDEAAIMKFKDESVTLLSSAKFDLRGWEWNSSSHKDGFPKEITVLGYSWELTGDSLTCEIDKGDDIGESPVTKKLILAIAHQIFDPIGFTIPLVICPKLLLQNCWDQKIGWNTEVPIEISRKFQKWCQQLTEVKKITIPRWIGLSSMNLNSAILHVFTDASKSAYTACAFIRIEEEKGVSVQLVQAKARIAPLKKLSINRLELLGCLIGARLSNSIKTDMSLSNMKCIYWTDSANALHWIRNEDQWGVYVWNRVEEIKSLTDIHSWRYVPGKMNPADLPSRGCTASQLVESSWWEGPEWLKLPEKDWPKITIPPDEDVLRSERKNVVICMWERTRTKIDTSWLSGLNINFGQMIRFVAIMKRLIRNHKKPLVNRIRGKLSINELETAENYIIMLIQNEAFLKNDPLLNKLELIQDDHGVLRVKTKILLREDFETFKTPAILPTKHPLVDIIIEYYHRDNSHAGALTLRALLRERFWVINSRLAVKKIIKNCFVCKWFSAKPFVTAPAQLPSDRVRDAAVFEVTGVDLTGHVFLSDGSKAWIVLYTCAIYRAIKLDLVTSLTTKAFILSLRRFIADKGRPSIIYSDNGTNLKGTDNCLNKVDWDEIHKSAAIKRIDWRFIPSKAPWWGGWWERLIGVTKNLSKRVLGKDSLDFEETLTTLLEVESVVNERPLTYMSEDSTELEALTPSMFTRDIKGCGVPDLDVVNAEKLNQKYRNRLRLKQNLQKRFRSEYISQLKHRKGTAPTRQIEKGELVLIADENQKRIFWPLARVLELKKSKDGEVRVAKIKTIKGEIERPVKLLVPLEIRSNENIAPLGIPNKYKIEILALDIPKKSTSKIAKKSNTSTIVAEKTNDVFNPAKYTRSGRLVKPVQRHGVNE